MAIVCTWFAIRSDSIEYLRAQLVLVSRERLIGCNLS
jgi:hypothetical protein